MQLSQKFLAELNLRQKKKEEQIMKNRVKQLNREEQRLQKQIKIAEFHARVADSVRRRREEDLANKLKHDSDTQRRIERQHMLNQQRKSTMEMMVSHERNALYESNRHNRMQLGRQSFENQMRRQQFMTDLHE